MVLSVSPFSFSSSHILKAKILGGKVSNIISASDVASMNYSVFLPGPTVGALQKTLYFPSHHFIKFQIQNSKCLSSKCELFSSVYYLGNKNRIYTKPHCSFLQTASISLLHFLGSQLPSTYYPELSIPMQPRGKKMLLLNQIVHGYTCIDTYVCVYIYNYSKNRHPIFSYFLNLQKIPDL